MVTIHKSSQLFQNQSGRRIMQPTMAKDHVNAQTVRCTGADVHDLSGPGPAASLLCVAVHMLPFLPIKIHFYLFIRLVELRAIREYQQELVSCALLGYLG